MRTIPVILAVAAALSTFPVSCSKDRPGPSKQQQTEQPGKDGEENKDSTPDGKNDTMIEISINGMDFTAVLDKSKAAQAFGDMLPLTLDMNELNGNEKYCDLGTSLPASPASVGNIVSGDLMLWGSDCLVLFYKSFKTPYSYTGIGRISNQAGLAEAVGKGNIKITFRKK